MSTGQLAQALMIAIRTHAGQVDKQGEPYLLHVLRVVEAVSDEAKVVAALHDVWEDGGDAILTAEAFPADATQGLSRAEYVALRLLTRPSDMSYRGYIARIAAGSNTLPETRRIAREVKLADLRDNLGRIPPREEAFEAEVLRPLVGPSQMIMLDCRETWDETWASLKARYEKAIKVLGAGVS